MTSCGLEELSATEFAGVIRDSFGRRNGKILKRGRERYGHVHRTHANHRSVEMIERLFGNTRRDFRCDTEVPVAFIHDNDARCLPCAFDDDSLVERYNGARVDDFRADLFVRQHRGRLEAYLHH